MIDKLLNLESHPEREEVIKSDARQRLWRMIVVSAVFLLIALLGVLTADEPTTTQRLLELCRML